MSKCKLGRNRIWKTLAIRRYEDYGQEWDHRNRLTQVTDPRDLQRHNHPNRRPRLRRI